MDYERHSQVTPSSPLEEVIRAEMNLQCSAARERARSMRDFESRAIALATMDEHMAASCLSSLPAGRQSGRMRYAPTIGVLMAEVIGASYGNLRVDSLLVEQTPRRVRARGFALDMESNFGASADIVEVRDAGIGKPWDEGMRSEIARLATAKARREAIFLVAPKSVCQAVQAACLRVALGNPEAMARSLAAICAWVKTVAIREERIWRALDVAAERDLNMERIGTLLGLRTAITDGDTTLDEAFPADLESPKFIPPHAGAPSPYGHPPRSPSPSAAAHVAHLVAACQVTPETVLEYLRAKGQGTYRSLPAVPEAVLACVVRAWPDVVAELAHSRRAMAVTE